MKKQEKRKISLLVVVLLILIGTILLASKFFFTKKFPVETPNVKVGDCSLKEAGISQDDLSKLYDAYSDPSIQHVRIALDNYLHGSHEGVGDFVVKGLNPKEFKDGLANFDKTYYSSKFMVYSVNNQALGGGKEISLIFINKPDKIFSAWVYQLGSGGYELRDFRDAGISSDQMKQIVQEDHCFLTDEKLRM